jgi:hypothetical protein
LLDRYPDLRLLPGCEWERLGVPTLFGLLFGAASRHFASVQLAALAGILSVGGVADPGITKGDYCIRTLLNLMRERFGIATPQAITVDMWDAWGRDAALMRTLTNQIGKYAAAVNYHTPAYVERLSHEDQARIRHLLLPPLPHQFRERFVPMAEHPCGAATQAQSQNRRTQRVRNRDPGAHARTLPLH